jgi:hypothetical protein
MIDTAVMLVPDVFEEKAYKKGTWAKNMNFHKLEVSMVST